MRYHHKPSVLTAATSGILFVLTAFIWKIARGEQQFSALVDVTTWVLARIAHS
jgi:hypothetical protein